jgi:hypothetical protein
MKATPTKASNPLSSGVIPSRPAQVLNFEAGSLWRLGAASVSIVKPISVGWLVVRHLISQSSPSRLPPTPSPRGTVVR